MEIPANEISTNNNQLFEIPESLKSALRIYFLGVVAGEINKDQRNRTMLVHPSRLQETTAILQIGFAILAIVGKDCCQEMMMKIKKNY